MRRTGAWLAARALEQVGVRLTFGIPGVHNTELYDELGNSGSIYPILVTHEGCGAFMADAVSRSSDTVGCLVIVPAAGVTHAMSGIGEAFLDGIPMLVLSGGIRRDTGRAYQLHDIDHRRLLDGITKAAFLVERHADVVPTIHRAHEIAVSGVPGPVFVELAGDVQLLAAEVDDELPAYRPSWAPPQPDPGKIHEAATILGQAEHPGLYLGWGARDATDVAAVVADLLGAPVATTLQGLSVFPADHPLHVGFGWGPSAVPAARKAFRDCDALLAVGVRFAELATGSYGMPVPEDLVHVDIDPEVFDRNYPARVAIEADARAALQALAAELGPGDEVVSPGTMRPAATAAAENRRAELEMQIAHEKEAFRRSWTEDAQEDRVSPGIFFAALRERLPRDAFLVVDDGNHTFLAAEQFPVLEPRRFLSPTDFNCMGYCVPAAIGVKLANPGAAVAAVVGDGGFLMTGMEILTAADLDVGVPFFVFHDGELAQISQLQEIPLNRKTCTVLGRLDVEGVATATGAEFLRLERDEQLPAILDRALEIAAAQRPVIVDVNVDYSRKSCFTRGVVRTNLGRLPLRDKLRVVGRALRRHLTG